MFEDNTYTEIKQSQGSISASKENLINNDGVVQKLTSCAVCKITFSGHYNYRVHLSTPLHSRNVAKLHLIELSKTPLHRNSPMKKCSSVFNKTGSKPKVQYVSSTFLTCKICKKRFYSQRNYTDHMKSKKHKRKLIYVSTAEKLKCGICEKSHITKPFNEILAKNFKPEGKAILDGIKSFEYQGSDLTSAKNTIKNNCVLGKSNKTVSYPKAHKFYQECKMCRKKFFAVKTYVEHIEGKMHRRKLEESKEYSLCCIICCKNFDNLEAYNVHMSSPMHNKMPIEGAVQNLDSCAVCKMTFSGHYNFEVHLSSSLHSRNVAKLHLDGLARTSSSY